MNDFTAQSAYKRSAEFASLSAFFRIFIGLMAVFVMVMGAPSNAYAISAFFLSDVSKKLSYESSVMVVSRDENRTVITLAPQYTYDGQSLGVLIPVPNLVSKTQIRFGSADLVQKIVDFSAPRIVPYQELNVCNAAGLEIERKLLADELAYNKARTEPSFINTDALHIDLIKAEDFKSKSVASVLHDKGFDVNKLQEPILKSYQDAGVEFILVSYSGDASEVDKTGVIPPIQIAYESGNFILPLGLSSDVGSAAQDLTLIMLSRNGLVVPKDLPVKPIDTAVNLPFYTASNFTQTYQSIFDQALTSDNFQSVFLEYSGDINWCPQCDLTKKLSVESLRELGVWWLDKPVKAVKKGVPQPKAGIDNVYLTRLHLRHTDKTIFGKVAFEAKPDKSRFVVSYNAYKPYLKAPNCELGRLYKQGLPAQYHSEVQNFNRLTNIAIKDIKDAMEASGQSFDMPKSADESLWWERMWSIKGSK